MTRNEYTKGQVCVLNEKSRIVALELRKAKQKHVSELQEEMLAKVTENPEQLKLLVEKLVFDIVHLYS